MKKQKFDTLLLVAICIPIMIGVSFVIFVVHSAYDQRSYWSYIEDLSASTVYAYKHDGLKVTKDEETFFVTDKENVYRPFQLISVGGRGKPQKKVPESNPNLVFDFGDGSNMQLWHMPIKNADTPDGYGMFIRYENAEGKIYCYDTDKVFLRNFNF